MTDLDKLFEGLDIKDCVLQDGKHTTHQVLKQVFTHTLQTYRDEIVAGLPEKKYCTPSKCGWALKDKCMCGNQPAYTIHNQAIDEIKNHINSVSERRGI